MPTILIGLLAVITIASIAFLVVVARLSVEEADLWLRPITGLLLLFTFLVGGAMLFTGYFVVDKLGVRVAEAQTEAAKAKERADQEAIKRLEMEKSIAPRYTPFFQDRFGKTNVDSLEPFAGTEVVLWYFPDDEPQRAAANIDGLLRQAGWNSGTKGGGKRELSSAFFDGVVVEPHFSPIKEETTDAAADALVDFLRANNWLARKWTDESQTVPPKTVRINVGMKPMPYFLNKEMRDAWNLRWMAKPPIR